MWLIQERENTDRNMHIAGLQCIERIEKDPCFDMGHHTRIALGIHRWVAGSHANHRYHKLGHVQQAGHMHIQVQATPHLSVEALRL